MTITMTDPINGNGKATDMPDSVFNRFTRLIYDECGITINESKKCMLSVRLNKRLKSLGIGTYSEYYNYLISLKDDHSELRRMIDVITTNKTDFFREDNHFAYLSREALPSLMSGPEFCKKNTLNIWSAGCSSGEEPYTIGFVCAEYFRGCSARFRILATDISDRVLETAGKAIYRDSSLEIIPERLKRKYFMAGTGSKEGHHRVVPELRERVEVSRFNLIGDDFGRLPMQDIIFCRNVIIYFDRETQKKLHHNLFNKLNRGGYLFIGSSETLVYEDVNYQRMGPTIFRKT